MKTIKIFLLSIYLLALSSSVFSQQCPPSALKVQSPICDTPKNLNVSNIICTSIQLNWQGNKEQKYVVAATGTDNTANTVFETKAAAYTCDENGNCSATVSVKEGAKVNWNVQAICNINGAIIYSPKAEGAETVIPYCQPITANKKSDININEAIHVYPNPTTRYLNVEYHSKTSGTLQLKVYDVTGKAVFNTSGNAKSGNNKYTLNLHALLSGTYVLELNNSGSVSKVKFVLIRK